MLVSAPEEQVGQLCVREKRRRVHFQGAGSVVLPCEALKHLRARARTRLALCAGAGLRKALV